MSAARHNPTIQDFPGLRWAAKLRVLQGATVHFASIRPATGNILTPDGSVFSGWCLVLAGPYDDFYPEAWGLLNG